MALLRKEEWENLITNKPITHVENIFIYALTTASQSLAVHRIIDYLSESFNVIYANSSQEKDSMASCMPSINEWLGHIRYAKFVITDSFHCTLFSILFNIPFATIIRADGGKMSSRLTSLLNRLELGDRYIEPSVDKIQSLLNKDIDWDKVNNIMSNWRKTSSSKLLSAITN